MMFGLKNNRLAVRGLFCLLSLGATLQQLSATPYDVIVTRNPFDLKEPVKPAAPPPPPPPPTDIFLTGIANISSVKRAFLLIKPPGGKEESKILRENEAQDSLEVLEINEAAGSVKLKHGGVIRELSFKSNPNPAMAKPPAPAPPGLPAPQNQFNPAFRPNLGTPTPGASGFGNMPSGIGEAQGGSPTIPTRSVRVPPLNQAAGGVSAIPQPQQQPTTLPGAYVPPAAAAPPQLTPEEQIILMEVQRSMSTDGPPLPPTPLSPQ